MLSLILYGRNDAHGYNLHKRVAISLNCMAEVLDGENDEIVFVDFNTPDPLPTLPEAIADTLTAKARRVLRVLRVRPEQVEPWRHLTHLPVLEPLARNVALRRCHPGNSWVLSTNTDMIFMPPASGASLSATVAGLAPGIYHLPRFEVPEGLWERFDRTDPVAAFAALGRLAPALHLPEIVAGSPPALFDNHGDFQLVPRDWLVGIDGFDEGMLNGWIVDSNTSCRLALRHGPAHPFPGGWQGYHCDHTRQPGTFHGRHHVENDFRRYVAEVREADLPGQRPNWGLAGATVEEIRLDGDRTDGELAVLLPMLGPPPPQPPATVYAPEVFDLAHYPVEHVLPFLCDLLVPLPRHWQIAWSGGRDRVGDMLAEALLRLGFTQPLRRDLPAALAQAEVLVFEFGAASQDLVPDSPDCWTADDLERLAGVRRHLFELVDLERARLAEGRLPRLVIAVNAVHNRFEPAVHDCLTVARDPYSTRLRHGAVLAEPPSTAGEWTPRALTVWLERRLGRRQVPITEAVRLSTYVEALRQGRIPPGHETAIGRAALVVCAALRHPAVAAAEAERAAALVETLRPGHGLYPAQEPVLPGPDSAPSRLVNWHDWDDPSWLALARRYLGGAFVANCFRRDAGLWRTAHILRQLQRLGVVGPAARVAVVAARVDALWDVLSEMGCRVCVVDVGGGVGLAQAPVSGIRVASRVTFAIGPEDDGYDAVIVLAETEAASGWVWRLRPGGVLVQAAEVELSAPVPPPLPTGLEALPSAPLRADSLTLDAFVRRDERGRAWLPGLWLARRDGAGHASA